MHLIILPGNSKEYNEQWLHDAKKNFKDLFETSHIQIYKHWKENEPSIDIAHEVDVLAKTASAYKTNHTIFAKSAGVVTAITAITEGKIFPKNCVFVGCPFKWAVENSPEFKENFKKLVEKDIPLLFIQQTDDPFYKYKDLEKFLKDSGLKNYKLIEAEGNNHAYDNFNEIKKQVKNSFQA